MAIPISTWFIPATDFRAIGGRPVVDDGEWLLRERGDELEAALDPEVLRAGDVIESVVVDAKVFAIAAPVALLDRHTVHAELNANLSSGDLRLARVPLLERRIGSEAKPVLRVRVTVSFGGVVNFRGVTIARARGPK